MGFAKVSVGMINGWLVWIDGGMGCLSVKYFAHAGVIADFSRI